jgi:hypothetical protein
MRSALIPCALVWVALSSGLSAQSNFGEIKGTVVDPSGSLVAGATVEILDVGTNAKVQLTTSVSGTYSAPSLRPVLYQVTVTAPGFQKVVVRDVKVDTAKTATVDVSLKVGDVSTTVDVTGEAPILQTYSGAVINTVDQKTINDVPLNGRNTLQLALILPGAAGSAGTEISEFFTNEPLPGRELSINGSRIGGTQFLADGANVTSVGLARMSISFSPDTIQEFSVQQANYSAQFAQAGGALIQQTTKSGTNEFRGTAYWFHRQKALTASPFAAQRQAALNYDPRPPLRRQQIGFTVGGPVEIPKVYRGKDRTFFFASYEPTRQLSSNPGGASYSRMPTADEINGDFSKTLVHSRNAQGVVTTQPTALLYRQFIRRADGTLALLPNPNFNPGLPAGVNNARFQYQGFELFNPSDPDPARRGRVLVDAAGRSYVNPVSQAIARALYPAPNITNPAEIAELLGANFVYFRQTTFDDDRYTVRLDHRLTDRHTVYGRWTEQPQFGDRAFRDPIQHGLISDANNSRQIMATLLSTLNATMVNEFRANYVFGNFGRNFPRELLDRDLTNEFLNIGGSGAGAVNILGYGAGRFFDGGAPKGANAQVIGASFDGLGFNSPQDVGRNIEHNYSLSDDFSWVRGNKTLKLGFNGSHLQLNQANLGVGSLAGGRYNWNANILGEKNCSSAPVGGTLAGCSGSVLGGDKFADFMLGVPDGLQVQTENLSIPYYYRWMNFGGYGQFDWKVLPSLTFNIGLRYQYQSPRWEKFDRQGQLNLDRMEPNPFVLDSAGQPRMAPVFEFAGYDGRSRYLTPAQKDVLEPRFGFAWTPEGDWNSDKKFVLRGGYGITHGTLMGNDREPIPNIGSQTFGGYRQLSYVLGANDWIPPSNTATCGLARCGEIDVPMQFGFNNPVLASDPRMFNLPDSGLLRPGDKADSTSAQGNVRQDVRYQATGVVGYKDFRMPTIQTYSLLAQYQFMSNTVFTAGYQGSRGSHLFGPTFNINRVDPFTGQLPVPGYSARNNGAIYVLDPTNSSSTYHALILEVERRFYDGLQFRFNYAWSKAMDDSSGGIKFPIPNNSFNNASGDVPLTRNQTPYNSRSERAVSSTDTPHIFNMVAFYDMPFGRGRKFANTSSTLLNALVGGWQISGLGRVRSGYPITATLGRSNSLDTGIPGGAIRPDIDPSVPLVNPDWTPKNAQFVPYVNPKAFYFPEPGQYGNAARNYTVRLPWMQTLDVSIMKRIAPWKDSRRYFELRGEFFNVLNHRTFESNINNTFIFSGGDQNPLLAGSVPNQTSRPGVKNRFANLRSPGVWDAMIAISQGTPVDAAIASLPGPGSGGVGCPSNAGEIGNTTNSLSPACVARTLQLNRNFYVLNQNTVQSRIIQLALKFYF